MFFDSFLGLATVSHDLGSQKINFKHAKMEKLKNENLKNALPKPPLPINTQGFKHANKKMELDQFKTQ